MTVLLVSTNKPFIHLYKITFKKVFYPINQYFAHFANSQKRLISYFVTILTYKFLVKHKTKRKFYISSAENFDEIQKTQKKSAFVYYKHKHF